MPLESNAFYNIHSGYRGAKEETGGRPGDQQGEDMGNLAYANDIVLMTKEANDMREMLKRFSNFLEKRELNLSVEKSKMMTFRKGRGRRKKEL